ncbi:MAG: O-antigen ligase family protein [Lachnospiraceae bacterium]|nr:O-antigen ligase family protein [Lachnospiraceae bacterium]
MNMTLFQKRLTTAYLLLFTLYSLATRFTVTAAFMDGSINNTLYRLLLITGCLLALWQFVSVRKRLRSWDTGLLLLFLILLCIGIFLNRDYGLFDNIYGLFTFGFQLVLFYYLSHIMTEADFTWLFKRLILLGSFLWNIACIGSIAQYLFNIHYIGKYTADRGFVRQGITDGRLFGLFTDPNFAAFTSLLLIFGLWHVLCRTALRLIRLYAYASIVIHSIYIVMSNSRTVYLSVVGSVLFFVLFRFYKEKQDTYTTASSMAGHLFIRGLCTLLCLAAVYCIILFSLQGVARLIVPDRDTATEMMRDDIDGENISNNRFAIWSAYMELYTEKPVFGFSLRSALPYATEKNPEGYLAQTQYVTHNSYISLLVETGITGFLVMAVFLLALFVRVIKRSRSKEPVSDTYVLATVWILSILIFCLCFHDIFFTMNLETFLFWWGLGYLRKESGAFGSSNNQEKAPDSH